MLTDAEITAVANTANFTFDVDLRDGSDTYLVCGDGIDDLDKVLAIMTRNPFSQVTLDVDPMNTAFKPVTMAEITAIREAYVAKFGAVNKPDEYDDRAVDCRIIGTALPLMLQFVRSSVVPLTCDLTRLRSTVNIATEIPLTVSGPNSPAITCDMTETQGGEIEFGFFPVWGVQGYTDHTIEFNWGGI